MPRKVLDSFLVAGSAFQLALTEERARSHLPMSNTLLNRHEFLRHIFLSICMPDNLLPKYHIQAEPQKKNRPTEAALGQPCGLRERPVWTKMGDLGTENRHVAPGPGSLTNALRDSFNMPRTDRFQASEASSDSAASRWAVWYLPSLLSLKKLPHHFQLLLNAACQRTEQPH